MTEKVLKFFKEICSMPHGSGNCSIVGDYLLKFAKDRGLNAIKDEKGNVLISAPAVKKGNLPENTVILQGHQDMVCVKEESCKLDMSKDPLDYREENGMIYAKGTSLGADDGIGVAMALAVLDNKENPRPPIEALFTVDEETGMSGAAAFDTSLLKGRRLINLDSEEEGVITCACAGGERVDVLVPLGSLPSKLFSAQSDSVGNKITPEPAEPAYIKIGVTGLQGGHSGCDIHKGRLSALRIITDILGKISDKKFALAEFYGGRFDNVICSEAYAVILMSRDEKKNIRSRLLEIKDKELLMCMKTEKNASIELSTSDTPYSGNGFVLGFEETKEFLDAMDKIPQGVTLMMKERPDAVDTSMNMGTVKTEGNRLKITFSLRSSCDDRRRDLEKRVTEALSGIHGCKWSVRDPYPAWNYVPKSTLRDVLCESYKELFGKEMETAVTHGGLECGYFASGIKGCEIVSIGPQIDDIHSVKEKISNDSIDRTMKLLVKALEKL